VRARPLAWIAGAAGLAAVVIAAVLALPEVDPVRPAGGPVGSGTARGSSVRGVPDAAAADPAGSGEPPPGRDVDQAAQLVASARAEVAAGRIAQARTLLARAYALDPLPATLLELAAVELQTGHCREARRAVQRVIADGAGTLSSQAWELMGRIGRCD
jgi:hypothetical protein